MNSFKYKGIDLNIMVDMRYGGDVYMGSIQQGASSGTLDMTLQGREGMLIQGIDQTTNQANTQQTIAQKYWTGVGSITEEFIYDATNIRLREVSLGYSIPKTLLQKTPFNNIRLSAVARNVLMIYSKTKGFDPEGAFTTGNAQGVEFGSMPTMRSLGFNLNLTF